MSRAGSRAPRVKGERGRCEACGGALPTDGEQFKFQHRVFHAACFRCHRCGTAISTPDDAQGRDGRPLCGSCAASAKAGKSAKPDAKVDTTAPVPSCKECARPITSGMVEKLGSKYHMSCWKCKRCNTQLRNVFEQLDGKVLCEPCYFVKLAES